MKVKDGLSRLRVGVDDDTIAAFADALGLGNFARFEKQMSEQHLVFFAGLVERSDGLFRNDENMGRRLGIDVAKSEAQIVFKNDFRWDLARDDFLKNRAHDQPHI